MRKEQSMPVAAIVIGESDPADDSIGADRAVRADRAILVNDGARTHARPRTNRDRPRSRRGGTPAHSRRRGRSGHAWHGLARPRGTRQQQFHRSNEARADVIDPQKCLAIPRRLRASRRDNDDRRACGRERVIGLLRIAERKGVVPRARESRDAANRPLAVSDNSTDGGRRSASCAAVVGVGNSRKKCSQDPVAPD